MPRTNLAVKSIAIPGLAGEDKCGVCSTDLGVLNAAQLLPDGQRIRHDLRCQAEQHQSAAVHHALTHKSQAPMQMRPSSRAQAHTPRCL